MLTSSSSMRRRASAHIWSIALASPSAPREARNSIDSVPTLRPGSARRRTLANSSLVSTGPLSSTRRQSVGFGSRRLPSAPSQTSDEVMISSRMLSMGGLVTCAKSCLK